MSNLVLLFRGPVSLIINQWTNFIFNRFEHVNGNLKERSSLHGDQKASDDDVDDVTRHQDIKCRTNQTIL